MRSLILALCAILLCACSKTAGETGTAAGQPTETTVITAEAPSPEVPEESTVPDPLPESVPALTVVCGESRVEASTGNCSWSATVDGETTAVIACGVHPLEFDGYEPIARGDGSFSLEFACSYMSVTVLAWPDSLLGSEDYDEYEAACLSLEPVDGVYTLPGEGGYVIEATVVYDSATDCEASYAFYIV